MSEPTPQTRGAATRARVQARLQTFNSARGQRVLGPAEVIALAGSALILLLVVVSYLYFYVPTRSRLNGLVAERSRLQNLVKASQGAFNGVQSTQARVLDITQSLDNFESRLVSANSGRMGLYDSLNSLIRKNALKNTSGPTYTPLEPIGSKGVGATGARSANTKWQSIYPGIAISVTVEGQYENLRRFIQDIEKSGQFVIINSVELERSTETNAPPAAEGASSTRPTAVSLRLGMSTYFQRGSTEAAAIGAGVN